MLRLTLNLHWVFLIMFTWFTIMKILQYQTMESFAWLVPALAYGVVVVGIFHDNRIAWLLSNVPPAYLVVRLGPMVVYNLYMFSKGHESFFDSPGTILLVYFLAIVVILPAMLLIRLSLTRLWQLSKMEHQESQ